MKINYHSISHKAINLLALSILLSLSVSFGLHAQTITNLVTENDGISHHGNFKVDTVGGLALRESEIRAGLLYDYERNTIVWEKDMYYAYPIASLTKMMVALLAVEDIRAGKRDWSDEVKVTRVYRKSRRTRATYKAIETYTLESLVQLAMIPSNNLACSDIGEFLCGDVPTFVARMNAKAQELGMNNTFYSNPSGLPAPVKDADNSSSPHDLLILALELIKYDEILKITSIGYAEVSNDKRTGIFRNHNHLVIDYENDVDGLKTGFTKRAKNCLVATAKKEGHRIISIVLGVDGPYLRNELVSAMLNNYYEYVGCGPMIPTSGGPVARKSLLSDPSTNNADADVNSNVTYKTVWTKKRVSHKVRSGESLSVIAGKYNCTYQQIKRWNKLHSDRIYAGQRLLVYVNVPQKIAVQNADVPDNEDETVPQDDDGALQVTENGNSTQDSTLANDEPVNDSAATNTTASVQKTVAASKSTAVKSTRPAATKKPAPAPVKKSTVPSSKYLYHTVQPGDTLWGIAEKYDGISADDIKRVNKIYNARALRPGTKLKIKVVAGS